jgi:hypothetical protein
VTPAEASALLDLQGHWDTAYDIWLDSDGRWYAAPLDGREQLTAPDPDRLRLAIREDYAEQQRVQREAGDSTGRTGAAPDEYPTAPLPHCSDT